MKYLFAGILGVIVIFESTLLFSRKTDSGDNQLIENEIIDIGHKNMEKENSLRYLRDRQAATSETVSKSEKIPTHDSADVIPVTSKRMKRFIAAMDDPTYRATLASVQKRRLPIYYAELFEQLNLSPEATETFKDYLVQKQQMKSMVKVAARSIGSESDVSEVSDIVKDMQAPVDKQIRALLGENGYENYIKYELNGGARTTMHDFDALISNSQLSLDTNQKTKLNALLSAYSERKNLSETAVTGLRADVGAGLVEYTPAGEIKAETLDSARSFLSPDQMVIFTELQQAYAAKSKLRYNKVR